MIAFVEAVSPVDLSLSGIHFEYASAPSTSIFLPPSNRIKQWGNGGINTFGRIATDPQGNIYQAFLSSGPDFSGIETDSGSFYLVKYDLQGNQVWIRKHGIAVDSVNKGEMPFNIIANNQHVYIAGHTKGGYGGPVQFPNGNEGTLGIIAKYDASNGNLLEVERTVPDGENGNVWSASLDVSGNNIYVTGGTSANGANLFPHSSPYIKKLATNNLSTKIWDDVIVEGTGTHPNGPYYFQISNESIAKSTYWADSIGNGFLYISGYATAGEFLPNSLPGVCNVWVAKYDVNGTRLWATAFQSPTGNQYPWGTAVDDDGNVYIVGQTYGAMGGATPLGLGDGFITKYSSDGVFQWTKLIGTTASDDLHSIQIIDNTLLVGGTTWGDLAAPNKGYSDAFMVSLDLNGNITSPYQFGTEKIDYLRDALISNNQIWVFGITEGSLAGTASGGWDVFLASFDPSTLSITTSVTEANQPGSSFFIYPNPSSDILRIQLLERKLKTANFNIYNEYGQLIKSGIINSVDYMISLSDISSGVYFINIITEDSFQTRKFIKR